jgi:FG-GAP repeat/FlgD Ig-like domain
MRRLRAAAFSCLPVVALAFVALTPAHAISTRTLFSTTGSAANDQMGYSVSTAGDVNGDGFADVIVGAPLNDAAGADAGRAFVYFGGPAADSVADLILTGVTAGDEFGYAVGTAGDVNGDGYADVIVGAPNNDAGGANAGRAYVFFGGTVPNSTVDLTLTGVLAADQFGSAVALAGDVNGDGFSDVVVGAPLNDAGGSNAGRAYVYFGGLTPDATIDLTFTGAVTNDQFGLAVGGAGDVNGDGFSDVIVGAPFSDAVAVDAGRAYLYFGGPAADGLADLTLTGATAGDELGFSVATAGDVNGDGFADIVVGAPFSDVGGTSAGQATVYFGGGLADATADLTLTGADPNALLGWSVGTAGDANGDGFADVLVGAVTSAVGGSNAGEAMIYFGAASPNSVADVFLIGAAPSDEYGFSVGMAGDVNGDGFDDVIVGALLNDRGGSSAGRATVTLIYPYQVLSPNGGEQWVAGQPAKVRWLGHDAADIAVSLDGGATFNTLVNGVGGAEDNEVTVIAPGPATALARVRVSQRGATVTHSNSDPSDGVFRIVLPTLAPAAASRRELTVNGAAANDQFGFSVAGAGDLNGDGFSDVVVSAIQNDAGGADAGRVYVYFGGPTADAIPDLTLTGAAAGDEFGYSVAGAGDVNGDGFADLIVGAIANDAGGADAGRAYVFYGGPALDAVVDLTLTGAAAGDFFGWSVGTAGDVNGDGFDDLLIGAPFNDAAAQNAGRAYVYFGGPSPDATADLTLTGELTVDQFGAAVGTAGDLNGDGFADFVVGAPGNDGGGAGSGRAYVYLGGRVPSATASMTLTGDPASQFGYAVGTAGDINGDGFADLLVGANVADIAGTNSGAVFVYEGGPRLDDTADLTLLGAHAGDNFGSAVSTAGDVNGDGYSDLIVGAFANAAQGFSSGRAYVYYGGTAPDPFAALTLTAATAGEDFGFAVSGAGDVNGDGFADVIVGAIFNDVNGSHSGQATLYDFRRYFVLSPNGGETWNVGATRSVSWLGTEPADVWLSVDGGASFESLANHVGGAGSNTMTLRVPHLPTRFARIKVTPSDLAIVGSDVSDSLFTIQTSVALLSLAVQPAPDGGALLTWSTDPGVAPGGLAGYRVYRVDAGAQGAGTRIGPDLIAEGRYLDVAGATGSRYRVAAVNGLGEELMLGEVSLLPARPLAAWPLPYRGGDLHVSFATIGGYGGVADDAAVTIYDLAGRQVRQVARGLYRSGLQTATWDGRDESGRDVGNGIYFLLARSGGRTARVKLAVVR